MTNRILACNGTLGLLLGCVVAAGCNGDDPPVVVGGTDTTGGVATDTSEETDPSATSTAQPTTSADDTTGPEATCEDGIRNQDETDVDCGGETCPACEPGQSCGQGSDCTTEVCTASVCAMPTCNDGVQNGNETDIDCGGSCAPCGDSQGCLDESDCTSGVCVNEVCLAASCRDGVQNGNETDVDCGGSCEPCPEGGACLENGDCATAFCHDNECLAVECVVNAHCSHLAGTCMVGVCNQTTYECEQSPAFQGAPCNDGDACTNSTCNNGTCGGPQINCSHLDAPCTVGVCEQGVGCVAEPIGEGGACSDGNACTSNTTCSEGVCGGGDAVDCSHLDAGCMIGVCNQFNGTCQTQQSPGGSVCEGAISPCSDNTSGTCDASGACVTDDYVPFWTETFADNAAGWTLGPEWEIGPAVPAALCAIGQDPAFDVTQAGDNGIAGVVIGGCSSATVHGDYCLTSPVIDVSGIAGRVVLDYWRSLHSDGSSWMQNKVQVFNGTSWVNVWTGSPNDPGWLRFVHDLTDHKNPNFQIRYCFSTSGGVFESASWNLDDIHLLTCP